MIEERLDRARRVARSGERIAVVLAPEIEDGVRRGIVLAPRALRHLFLRLLRDKAAKVEQDPLRQSGSLPRWRLQREHARSVFQNAERHRLVDKTDAFRAPRVD
jgi:hypothetical protein